MPSRFQYITPPDNAPQAPFRVLSTLIVRAVASTGVSPNQVTLLRAGVVAIALLLFASGNPAWWIGGVGLFYVFEVLDHVDGDLARHTRQFTRVGPLLEQFVDTWSSRPSNLLGLSLAIGGYREASTTWPFILFGATVFGRLMWLEYRDYFGWVRSPKGPTSPGTTPTTGRARQVASVAYVWNNTFLLVSALLYLPLAQIGINGLLVGFAIVALVNNAPWIYLVVKGFREAIREDRVREGPA